MAFKSQNILAFPYYVIISFLYRFKIIYKRYFGYYVAKLDFPFDLMQPLPTDGNKILENGCKVLKKLGAKYFLSGGTILGIYRDGKLIPHDADLDVDVYGQINRQRLFDEFRKLGMKLGCEIYNKGKLQQIAFYTNNKAVFDIHFWEEIGEYVHNFGQENSDWKHPKKYYTNLAKIEYKQVIYPTPSPIENYLKYLYGQNWRIPYKRKNGFFDGRYDLKSNE